MPLLSPTVTFTRYMIREPVNDDFLTKIIDKISAKVFREQETGVQEVNMGWAAPRDPFRQDINLQDISFSDFIIISLRIDKRSVPASLLKKYCALEEKRTIDQGQIQRITSKMRQDIRERTRMQLLAKALPVPATHDLLWNTSTGSVLFFCRQDKICGMVEDLFKATFGMILYPVIPYNLGLQLIDRDHETEAYETMRTEVFV